jgi:predicted dehydrogenase
MSSHLPKPIRMGIIGVGAVVQRGLLPHLTQTDVADRVTVVGLVDPVVDRLATPRLSSASARSTRRWTTCSRPGMSMR